MFNKHKLACLLKILHHELQDIKGWSASSIKEDPEEKELKKARDDKCTGEEPVEKTHIPNTDAEIAVD